MFLDRRDAGEKLGQALETYRDSNALVLGIPRGGVEVGSMVARHLHSDFSIIIARKLPYPETPESGFGAVAEDGSLWLLPQARSMLSNEVVDRIIEEQAQEVERRVAVLRHGEPLPEIAGRTVILVDDGIAVGSTMRACILMCQNRQAARIVVAAPVAGRDIVEELRQLIGKVIILEIPSVFRAVAQVYENWYDVSDGEAIEILEQWHPRNHAGL